MRRRKRSAAPASAVRPCLLSAVLRPLAMNTHQAAYRTDIARLAEDMAERDAKLKARLAERDTAMAKRETRLILIIASLLGLTTAVLSFLIKF